jgi:heme A synthase
VTIGAGALILVGAAGAITALGDTLFPPEGLGGFEADPTGGFLVRLRWVHPILAVITAAYLVYLSRTLRVPEWMRSGLGALVVVQIGAGLLNVALLAPVWMQLVHLLVADALWIGFVVVGSTALVEPARVEMVSA